MGLKIAGEAQAELIKIGALALVVVGAVWWINGKRQAAVNGFTDLIDDVLSAPGRLLDAAGTAVKETVLDARQAVANSSPTNPGYELPPGWYRVKTWQGEIITRYPDAYKSLSRWDAVLVDP